MKNTVFFFFLVLLSACVPGKDTSINTQAPLLATVPNESERLYFASVRDGVSSIAYLDLSCLEIQCLGKIILLPRVTLGDIASQILWSPTGEFFFVASYLNGNMDILKSNADGTDVRFLLNSADREEIIAQSPNGNFVLFQKDVIEGNNAYSQVWQVGIDGTNSQFLVNGCCAQWSSDANFIYYLDYFGAHLDIFRLSLNDMLSENLTNSPQDEERDIAVSPDGTIIAYTVIKPDNNSVIYVMDKNGGGKVELISNLPNASQPVWSPDGTKIALISQSSNVTPAEIYVFDLEKRTYLNISNSPGFASHNPVWSPDGTQIAFDSLKDGNLDIYLVNSDGSNLIKLTNADNTTEFLFPSWQP
ncbi:MAG: hypothetical protein ABIL11_17820 [Chloroflexota bacterium]